MLYHDKNVPLTMNSSTLNLILPSLLNHGKNDKKSWELWYYIIPVEAVPAKTACMYCYVSHSQLSYWV
jgi:hypothetical protein